MGGANVDQPIETDLFGRRAHGSTRIVAVFSYRYDAHLVPGLIENIRPMVDGYAAWDDRAATAALSDEPSRRAALLAAARKMGADWILAVDPDERIEDGLAGQIREMTRKGRRCIWTFPLREMFSPTAYRADGVWGGKMQARLFPADIASAPSKAKFHGAWFPTDHGRRVRRTTFQIFHLRMAHPARRQHRWVTYAASDPERAFQALGYDYMVDDTDMRLVPIGEEAAYSPPFEEDGRLWAPAVADLPEDPPPDPFDAVLYRARFHALRNEAGTAARLLGTVAALCPGDALLSRAAERWTQWAGQMTGDGEDWARWCSPGAVCHDGDDRTEGPLAAVVLSYRAPDSLRGAVRSLIAQEPRPEIVVVNSGGGDPLALLGTAARHVRCIDDPGRLRVGAARNVGIDASRAPHIAFLAADCEAEGGWVAARLAQHEAGARALATPVIPRAPERIASLVQWLLLHGSRTPGTPEPEAQRYGVSYDRALFDRLGYFLPERQEGEDTEFNRRIGEIGWCPGAQIRHRYVTTLWALLRETARRGYRGGRSLPEKLRFFRRGLRGSARRVSKRSRFVRRRMRRVVARGEAPGWGWRHRALWEAMLALHIAGLMLGELSLLLRPAKVVRDAAMPRDLALRVTPDSAELRRAVAEERLAAGEPAPALEEAEEALLRAPWESACHRLVAEMAQRAEDSATADRRRAMAEALSGRSL